MRGYLGVFRQTFKEFNDDKVPRLGAALAYYTIFSVGPLLLIAVAMSGLIFGEEAAQGRISAELGKVLGSEMAKSLETMVAASAKPKSGTLATILGLFTLVIGAAGVFGQLKDALNTIWNVETKKEGGIRTLFRQRFLSMAMVFGIGFLLLVTLVIDTAISAMGGYLEQRMGGEAVLQVVQLAISFAVATVLFAAMFRILPDLKIAWRDVWLGAIFTSFLFVLGKWALGLYLGKVAPGSAYGAAGSLVILLIWVYWSAQILLFGAEFTQVYARALGSLKGDASKQIAIESAERVEGRPLSPVPVVASAPPSRGGGMKIVAGGAAGVLLGVLLSVISLIVLAIKSVKKIVLLPFR